VIVRAARLRVAQLVRDRRRPGADLELQRRHIYGVPEVLGPEENWRP